MAEEGAGPVSGDPISTGAGKRPAISAYSLPRCTKLTGLLVLVRVGSLVYDPSWLSFTDGLELSMI